MCRKIHPLHTARQIAPFAPSLSATTQEEPTTPAERERWREREEKRRLRATHAHALPVPDAKRPGRFYWKITIPACPLCGMRHERRVDGLRRNPGLPFSLPKRTTWVHATGCEPLYDDINEWIAVIERYEIVIDREAPVEERERVPDELRLIAMLADPANARSVGYPDECEVA